MKKIKDVLSKIDKKKFRHYLIFSIIFILILILVGSSDLTHARYETETNVKIEPQLAFFIVDVENQKGQIQLDGILPSSEPYVYRFDVSNFYKTKKANVDLKYEIEIITTTNIPLTYRVYKGNDLTTNIVTDDYYSTDDNGVYYRHLVIDGISYLNHNRKMTDTYILYVDYPLEYKTSHKQYAGTIELVDIKINAEQVV